MGGRVSGQYSHTLPLWDMDDLFTAGVTEGFGLMFYNARWYDPALGHMAQADSLVPPGVQGLDRYAYVNNSPVNYVDPSGHYLLENEYGGGCSTSGYCPGSSNLPAPTGGNNDASNDPNPSGDASEDIVDILYQLANFSQDMATLVDMFGSAMVLGITGAECAVGSTLGGIPGMVAGCVAGGIEGIVAYNLSGINTVETGFSLASLVLTLAADGFDDGQLGEASYTSVTTFVTGLVMVDPFTDLIIDGYASGYNHGYFNDLHTILNGGPLFVP